MNASGFCWVICVLLLMWCEASAKSLHGSRVLVKFGPLKSVNSASESCDGNGDAKQGNDIKIQSRCERSLSVLKAGDDGMNRDESSGDVSEKNDKDQVNEKCVEKLTNIGDVSEYSATE